MYGAAIALVALFQWNKAYGLVDASQAFQIAFERIEKNTTQHMPTDLRQRRVTHVISLAHRLAGFLTHTDHQYLVSSQVQRRANRRDLTHGAVAEILAMDFHRVEHERNGRRGHEMFQRDVGRATDTRGALPCRDAGNTLVEGNRLTRGITGDADAQGMQPTGVDRLLDARERQIAGE